MTRVLWSRWPGSGSVTNYHDDEHLRSCAARFYEGSSREDRSTGLQRSGRIMDWGEVVRLAMAAFGRQVGEWTANTDPQTRNSKEGLAVSELIQYLRLPPRAPKRKGHPFGCPFLFWSEVCLAAHEVCFASEVVLWTVKFLRK